jgi:hypothetical protein
MKRTNALLLLFSFAVISLAILFSSASNASHLSLVPENNPIIHGIVPFDKVANKTSFNFVKQVYTQEATSLYLPTWLPADLKPTAAWAVIRNGTMGGLVVLVYSAHGIEKISTAELTIEVSQSGDPSFASTIGGTATTINGWKAYVNDHANVGWDEYRQLYGPYAIGVEIRIGSGVYLFRGAPTLTMADMIKIVQSMTPLGE